MVGNHDDCSDVQELTRRRSAYREGFLTAPARNRITVRQDIGLGFGGKLHRRDGEYVYAAAETV